MTAVVLGTPSLTSAEAKTFLASPQADPEVVFAAIATPVANGKPSAWELYTSEGAVAGGYQEAKAALAQLLGPGSQVSRYYAIARTEGNFRRVHQATTQTAQQLFWFLETGQFNPPPPPPSPPTANATRIALWAAAVVAVLLLVILLIMVLRR